MNTLAIDCGHTKTKIALFGSGSIIQTWVFNKFEPTDAETIVKQHNVKDTIISNVSQNMQWQEFFNKHTRLIVLNSVTPIPFKNNYATAQTLGSDRIALVAAAVNLYPNKNCLIIDCGTCITYDFILADAVYMGGAISPGINTRIKAMHTFTGKLPLLQFAEPNNFNGNTTESCMQSGAFFVVVYEIEGFIKAYQNTYTPLQVVLSGGDAAVLAKHFKNNIFASENFLLHGLNKILEYNIL